MTSNGRRPELEYRAEVRLRCKDMAGVIEYDGTEPIVFRRRCKNQTCCPRREGHMAVHRWCIHKDGCKDDNGNHFDVGEYVTQYVPDKNPSEFLGQGARQNASSYPRRTSV